MMTYTDCPTCEDHKHGLHTCELSYDIICTCPICNALSIYKAMEDMNKEALLSQVDNFRWHIKQMTDDEYDIFWEEMKKI